MNDLSKRQAEVAERLARGASYKAIARDLGVSVRTVHTHVERAVVRLPGADPPREKLARWHLSHEPQPLFFLSLSDD